MTFDFSKRRMRQFGKPSATIELWCHKHWDPVLASRKEIDPINGVAATEFLIRAFIRRVTAGPDFQMAIAEGLDQELAMSKAMADLAPICCLFPDDNIDDLRERCRHMALLKTHPHLNDIDDIKDIEIPRRDILLPEDMLELPG